MADTGAAAATRVSARASISCDAVQSPPPARNARRQNPRSGLLPLSSEEPSTAIRVTNQLVTQFALREAGNARQRPTRCEAGNRRSVFRRPPPPAGGQPEACGLAANSAIRATRASRARRRARLPATASDVLATSTIKAAKSGCAYRQLPTSRLNISLPKWGPKLRGPAQLRVEYSHHQTAHTHYGGASQLLRHSRSAG